MDITPKLIAPDVPTSFYNYMLRSHRELEDRYTRLLDAMNNDTPDLRDRFTELEHGLLTHMEAEERYVLPSFARVEHDEAIDLIREHGAIRERLLELGVALDLHLVRYQRARDFIELLRAHAARETKMMYRWVDTQLAARVISLAIAHAKTMRFTDS